MALVIFGLIAIGAALLLVYYSRRPGPGASGARGAKRVQATVVPEKRYKKSEDGKVVYLFDEDAASAGAADDADDADAANGADAVDAANSDAMDGTGALSPDGRAGGTGGSGAPDPDDAPDSGGAAGTDGDGGPGGGKVGPGSGKE